jgi:hypothetical protein
MSPSEERFYFPLLIRTHSDPPVFTSTVKMFPTRAIVPLGNRTFDLSRPFFQFGARQGATRYPSGRRGRGYGTTATAGGNDPALPARHWRQPEKQ